MSEELKDMSVYRDGSCKASEVFRFEHEKLDRSQADLDAKRNFLEKHKNILWGLRFWCCCVDPEIELWHHAYRGEKCTPVEVARLFPQAQWERRTQEYDDTKIDWVGHLDGVTLIIKEAESLKPVKKPRVSGLVQL